MRVALLTANLGAFDPIVPPVPQVLPADWTLDVHPFTDVEFPPRRMAMTPRLQARIVKTCGWQMVDGYDAYVWLDASFSFQRPDCVAWVLSHLSEGTPVAAFRHPARQTIREEATFIAAKIAAGNRYLVPRYAGELVDAQMAAIDDDDLPLYATMLVGYRLTDPVRRALREWWWHISRYHTVDQLAFPFVMAEQEVDVATLPGDPYASPYLTRTRTHHQ